MKANKHLWIFVLGIILLSNVCLALRNPAAVYCKEMGYGYEIKETEKGQEGLCVVSSGMKFKSWDFLKGKVGKEYSYCEKQGYDIKTISKKGSEYAVCVPKKIKKFGALEISLSFAKSDEIPMTELMGLDEKLIDYEPKKISEESNPSLKTSFQELPLDLQKVKSSSQYDYTDFSSWDWRDPPAGTIYNKNNFTFFDNNDGWLTTIKNQGACGSCWSFASAASVEAKHELIQNNSRLNSNLAEQYSVSCDHSCYPGYTWPSGGCQGGCDGGWMDLNLRFMKLNGTVDDACFPYTSGTTEENGICTDKCLGYDDRLWFITDYTSTWSWNYTSEEEYHYYLTNNETEQWIIDNGPLVAGIGIGSNYGGYWDGSIYRCTDDTGINHAVVVLGYNDTGNDATSYWIIKNSWGTGWGYESGYFKLGFNECDFTTEFDFPHSVTPPDFKPSINVSSPSLSYISNSNQVEFNFTVINRVSDTSTCDLIINGSINQTNSSVNNNILTTLISNLPDGNYSWNISCWETGIGILNTSATRIFSVDTSPPNISFVSPTPDNNTNTSNTSIFINVTTNKILYSILLDWNGTNETMNGSGLNFYLNKTITGSGNFTYKVYGNDSADNTGVSETRIITINNTAPTQPGLTHPENQGIETSVNVTINWSVSIDVNEDSINYFIHFLNSSPPTYNGSTTNLYKTFTDLTDNETYYWYIIANDGTENSTASETRQFTINTTALTVTFMPPTPDDGVRQIKNYIYVNVTATHSSVNIDACLLLWNSTHNYTMTEVGAGLSISCFKNMTTYSGISYTYEVKANTTGGITGSSGTRTNLENTNPELNLTYPDNNSNITTTSTYLNWSGNDAEDSLTYYVYGNSTRNSTLLSLYNGTDLNYSWQIDDGTYYWYVVANDSYETNTSSEYKFNVNVSPILSGLSLSSASGYSDTNITIYANCSDTGSNVSSLTVSVYYPNSTWINYSMTSLNETPRYTKSYRPNIVGTYNFSFYCEDYYGNIADNETTGLQFTSSTRPSSSSGGGGGGYSVTYEQKSLGTLAGGSGKTVTFSKSATLAVTEITVTVKNKVTNAKIKVDSGSLPSGASKPSAKGSVYKYITITKTAMTDSDVTKGIIKFKVKRSWLTEKGYGKDTISLHRYYGNKWNKLTTTRDSQDTTYYYYSSESPGFSTFAITAEKATTKTTETKTTIKKVLKEEKLEAEENVTTEEPEKEEPPVEAPPEEEKKVKSNTALIITLIAVIIVFVIVSHFVQEKKQKKKRKIGKKKKKKHKTKRG